MFPYEQMSIHNSFPPKENLTRRGEIHINEATIGCLCYVLLKINSCASCICSTFHLMRELLTKEDKCIVVNSPRGVGNYYQFHHWKWDTEVTRLSLKSLRNPWLAGAAPVAPELRSDEATGEFVVTSLLMAFLLFFLNLCKREGREEEKQLQFHFFIIVYFNAYDQPNMISDPNNKFVKLAGVLAFGGVVGR